MTSPNEVKITVTSEDKTEAGFKSAEARGKSFGDRLKGMLGKAGSDGGQDFGLSFAGKVGPLLAKAPLSPPLLAAIGAAAPLISAAVTTSITVGAGLGAVGLGAALSAQDPRVKHGLDTLKANIGSELTIAARPFIPAMLSAVDKGNLAIRTMRPELDRVFAKASTYLDPLTDGAIGFVQNALPGFRKLVDAADPLVDILGEELPELGEDLAGTLDKVAESARRNQDEFRAILDTVGLLIDQIGIGVTLMDMFGLSPVTRGLLDWFGDTKDAAEEVHEPVEQMVEDFEANAKAMQKARAEALKFADALDAIRDQNLSAAEATLDYKQSLEETRDAMDKKRKVSDEESRALIGLAKNSNDLTSALDDQGRTAEQASEHHARLRRDFIRAAEAAGYTRGEARKLADQYLKTPRNVRTEFQANTDAARAEVAEYRRLLGTISRNITTNFNAGTHYGGLAHGGIKGAQSGGVRSNLTMVGEYGRELVELPPGSRVHTNPDTERAVGGWSGGSGTLEVTPGPMSGDALMDEIVKALRFRVRRDAAGSAQTFWGQ